MAINGKTIIHGIMGNPVSHSLSPAMHNAAFKALGLNSVYLPFPVSDVKNAIKGFRAVGVEGLSVTIPHKQAVMAELDHIDPVADKIGAVNTIVFDEGRATGLNTAWIGANRALEDHLNLTGKAVLILGAGGSARAIGFGLLEAGAEVILASRTPASGQQLAQTLKCPWHPLSDIDKLKGNILVNATSVGMAPGIDQSLIPAEQLNNFQLVMDIVYSPMETRLLREAKEQGCSTVNGLAMLLYQGVAQFELWTGVQAPINIMKETLLAGLNQ